MEGFEENSIVWLEFLKSSLKSKKQVVNACFFTSYIILENNTVATIELHSDQIWRDLRRIYEVFRVIKKFLNPKKAGY
jgi:hypothetical protein